ncbi:MAG TPA: class IV adenylate cyclase [Anaerolineales bacterium]|nr:class IV adenylate cyclase [Anaerolineales bacterium]
MSASGQETEAKFLVRDLNGIRSRLQELGARLLQERVLETNIRFDLPGAILRAEGRVLRLRRDTSTKFTYKSASTSEQGVLSREEIEFAVEDFEKAKRFLEALGYQKLIYYEKYRTTYALGASEGSVDSLGGEDGKPSEGFVHIMLDELPYGNFVEIEGETVNEIRAIADRLGLNWDVAIATSYSILFDRARTALNLSTQDLSFAEFRDIHVDAVHLGVQAADM